MSTKYYTNTESRVQTLPEYDLGLTTNYFVVKDEPDQVMLDNHTAPKHKELITLTANSVAAVNTNCRVAFPNPVRGGTRIRVQLETLVKNTLADGSEVEDPINMYLTAVVPDNGFVTDADVAEVFRRLVSVLHKDDGSYRFDELLRGGLKPTN
jgi:hypothetical protein